MEVEPKLKFCPWDQVGGTSLMCWVASLQGMNIKIINGDGNEMFQQSREGWTNK